MSKDQFQRLAEREQRLRGRRLDDPNAFMALAMRFVAAIGVGWAALLSIHWVFFSNPRWLALVHTIVFVLVVGYWFVAALFLRLMRRRMPELFDN